MDSVVSGLLTSDFGSWRQEERDTILTMLTPPPRMVYVVVSKISIHLRRSGPEKLNRRRRNDTKLNSLLQWQKLNSMPPWSNLNCLFFKILRTISFGHDVIHPPTTFPVWGFIMRVVIAISFAHERKTTFNDDAPGLLT